MGGINLGRVFLGGLAAGAFCVAIEYIAALLGAYVKLGEAAGVPEMGRPSVEAQLAAAALQVLIGGPLAVWLYAAVRPRFGAGPRTAVITAVYIWLVMMPYGWTVLEISRLLVRLPVSVVVILDLMALPLIIAALLLGARLYQEDSASAEPAG